jgi:hypothetical protein
MQARTYLVWKWILTKANIAVDTKYLDNIHLSETRAGEEEKAAV